MMRRTWIVLIVLVAGSTQRYALAASPDASAAWIEDFAALRAHMAAHYANLDWMVEQRRRLTAYGPGPGSLETATGLLVDLAWWLDTCDDDEVDPDVAVRLLKSGVAELDTLDEGQRERLREVLDRMAASEQHDGRRHALRRFPYEMGLVEEEPDDDEPSVYEWVRPEARVMGFAVRMGAGRRIARDLERS